MASKAILRRSGGSIILAIPRAIAKTLSIDAGSTVDLSVEGGVLNVKPSRRTLADRLAMSPKRPADWYRDHDFLDAPPVGRELI